MNDIVELHFIDGPLAGTRKMEHKSIIQRNRSYRHLEPTNYSSEVSVPNTTGVTWKQVTCVEHHYIPFSLPVGFNRTPRFAMLLDKGLG